MIWTAIVPLKLRALRKSRLASCMSLQERQTLSDRMAARVLAALDEAGIPTRVLSPVPWAGLPWEPDYGAGLNAELDRVRAALAYTPLLAISGDLPLLTAGDVRLLLASAGEQGVAIAPDRHGQGTNAIALHDARPFAFSFGERSFARHLAAAQGAAIIRDHPGLAFDLDTPADLDDARRLGWA
ncbi:2-phospho-L-lactate guanylyltransferase [Novosphingobium lubricantis]|jgi:2-phospho-L-lactate guanylyltransferase|uniref:2-phospho-L-lactate guanylyltransferase n=1 Tax=Novosphingobium sp. CCH12-A3 TaxID=1768752 RepID=UPI000780F068|nr:2-phospho-L-lactate guanylyltransferase [Novosphingobium sp. CCH12-A3]